MDKDPEIFIKIVQTLWEGFWEKHAAISEIYKELEKVRRRALDPEETDRAAAQALKLETAIRSERLSHFKLCKDLSAHMIKAREAGLVPDGQWAHYESLLPKRFDEVFILKTF